MGKKTSQLGIFLAGNRLSLFIHHLGIPARLAREYFVHRESIPWRIKLSQKQNSILAEPMRPEAPLINADADFSIFNPTDLLPPTK